MSGTGYTDSELLIIANALGVAQTNALLNGEKVRMLEMTLADRDAKIASLEEVIKTKDVQLIAHATDVENLRVTLGGKRPKRARKPVAT